MNKQEYLDKLNYEIGNMSAEQKEDISAIFREHFEQGALDGKSEEEICRDLGSPAFVAAQFLEDNRGRLDTAVHRDKEAEQTSRPRPNDNITQMPHQSSSFRDVSINRLFDSESINKLNVVLLASDIKIRTADGREDDKFRVTISGHSRNSSYDVYVSDGILYVTENKKFIFYNLFGIKNVRTEIYVPKSFTGTIFLKNSAGNVDIDGLNPLFSEIKATAGDIKISRLTGDIDLHSTAGNININNASGKISLHSTAGDIKLEDCDGSVEARTSAGNIKISTKIGHISAKTSAGNVKITAYEIFSLCASSSAGNIKAYADKISGNVELSSSAGNIKLETKRVAGSISARSSLGNTTVILPQDASMRISSKTSGKCKSEFISNPDSPYTLDVSASLGTVSVKSL